MSHPLIRSCDHYVVLEPGKAERILTKEETLLWLQEWLNHLTKLPEDLAHLSSASNAAKQLLDTGCELIIKPGFTVQWFAVRIDPSDL